MSYRLNKRTRLDLPVRVGPRLLIMLLCLLSANALSESSLQTAMIGDLRLQSGNILKDTTVAYRTSGKLNANKSNIIIMPSWFTGTTANLFEYGLIGPGMLADTNKYFVVSIDALSNGVSSSPSSDAAQSGASFPKVSISDMVNSQYKLLTEHLDIHHAKAVIGISMGGMQTFQWMGQYPGFFDKAVPIDGSPKMTSYDLVQWKTHEAAIELLQKSGASNQEIMVFLSTLNLVTLWTPEYFVESVSASDVSAYLANERKTYEHTDANDYLWQLRAMITHNVFVIQDIDKQAYRDVVAADVLVVAVEGDHMVNPIPGKVLANTLKAQYAEIDSNCGHMGTTCEAEKVARIVNDFLEK
ncbi:MAG: alpha/beta fold hydrolase [Pseudomonadales bacterium]